MSWRNNLKRLRQIREMSGEELSAASGVSQPMISQLEQGKKPFTQKTLEKLAKALGVTLSDIFSSNVVVATQAKPKKVPLISFVQAGDWTEVADQYHPGDGEMWVDAPAGCGDNAFALRVVGGSMEPRFREGDIIIVDPSRVVENGDYIVAKINDDEATFKKYVRDGGKVLLMPLNPAYPSHDVTDREWKIVGRVVRKMEDF